VAPADGRQALIALLQAVEARQLSPAAPTD
jgi:hypothetical protein